MLVMPKLTRKDIGKEVALSSGEKTKIVTRLREENQSFWTYIGMVDSELVEWDANGHSAKSENDIIKVL